MLWSRSASLIRMTRTSRAIASSILRKFSACACSWDWNSMRSSLDRPSTSSATGLPERSVICCLGTEVSKQQITERFGKPVAELVDGLSKLDRIEFQSQEHAQAENFRKMLLAMARDVRVILIKLADRLHNMRTLDELDQDDAHVARHREQHLAE